MTKSKTVQLTLGRTEKWKRDFYDGYNVVETQALAQGFIITSADEVLSHPSLYRYRVADYEEERERFMSRGYTNAPYCKGKAVATNNFRMVQEA